MLIDLALAQGEMVRSLFMKDEIPGFGTLNQVLEGAHKFNVQDVCDYFYNSDVEGWEDWQRGYPCCMPPFQHTWMETGIPIGREGDDRFPFRWGFLFHAYKYPADSSWQALLGPTPNVEGAVAVLATLILQTSVSRSPICLAETILAVDSQGAIQHEPRVFARKNLFPTDTNEEAMGRFIGCLLCPMLLALSFLNCKNVERVEHRPDRVAASRPPTPAERKGKTTSVRYYTLNIQPMRSILRAEGRSGEVGLKKALHICRGHFANYSEEKPLFGKLSGRFWVPAHVRGSKEAGEIKKDYRIVTPEAK